MSKTWNDMVAERRARRQPGAANARRVGITFAENDHTLRPGTAVVLLDVEIERMPQVGQVRHAIDLAHI